MAYVKKYSLPYKSQLNEDIELSFFQKDGSAGAVEVLTGAFPCFQINADGNADQRKYDSIISKTATVNINVNASSSLSHLTFIQATYEEWKLIATQDGTEIFHGFLIPEAGQIQLKDKPYTITVKATDGLGLLKNYPLTDVTGLKFIGRNSLISYVAGALAKNILGLPIRVYCNIYESSMNDRADGVHYDMFQQAKLNYRTFVQDSGDFVSCYDALEIILKQHFRLYYEAGRWVIYRIPEYTQVANVWYTDYDGGIPQSGAQEVTTHILVGSNQLIRPVTRDAILTNEIAIKSAKHTFNYVVPVDLVNNQKLNRLGNLIAPLSGVGYSAYQLIGWTQKSGTLAGAGMFNVSAKNAYIKTETNIYGVETDRYYVIEHDDAQSAYPLDNFLINDNDDFFVEKGDHLGISIETRITPNQVHPPDTHECLMVAILQEGRGGGSINDWWTLNPNGFWKTNGANLNRNIGAGVDTTEWETISIDSNGIIPVNGRVYVFLGTGNVDSGHEAHFRNLQFTYLPSVRGSLATVKGDYWFRNQTDLFIDKIEEEVFISDSPKRIIKGALWRETGETLTTPTWYRYGITEEKHFKELLNMGYFAHHYRRMLTIEGTFKGLKANDGATEVPLSFSKRYYFNDVAAVQRNYMLVPPLTIDVDRGWFKGKFMECYLDDNDVNETGDSSNFNYTF